MNIKIKTQYNQPLIHVCAFENQDHVDLRFKKEYFKLIDVDGNSLFDNVVNKGIWRIRVKKARPAKFNYYLILKESQRRSFIKKTLEKISNSDVPVKIKSVGGNVFIDDQKAYSNEKYIITAGPFSDERQARHHSKNFNQLNHCRIHRQRVEEGKGIIEIYDSQYDNFAEVKDKIILVNNKPDAYFEIKHFAISHNDEEKIKHDNLFFQGNLEISIGQGNTLTGINEIPVESYLKGVLYSEIGDHAEYEFAKCMAIAARSQIFARIGQCHGGEGFDFCSGSHCLRYYGKKYDDSEICNAIKETFGQIIAKDENVYPARFSFSCGGHTENKSGIWLNDDPDYITGKFDGDQNKKPELDLSSEEDIDEWIAGKPEVNCRIDEKGMNSSQKLMADSFRWEVFYTRKELQKIIMEKTGEEIGIIYEIIPISRGVSGRIKELEILGSLKNVRISGELNIRSAFSETFLNSSCFIIQPESDFDGIPLSFLFVGAGKGHGVGLCKVGAGKMASENIGYKDIIKHYYEKCEIKRIY